MGNCQATSDVVGLLVLHPDGRVERLYWSVTARQLMLQYPGNYVALVPAPVLSDHKTPLRVASRKLKLLPPDTTLQVGQQYRLVSFEDVLTELSEQKFVGRSSSMGARSKRVYSDQGNEFPVHEEQDYQEPLDAGEGRRSRITEETSGGCGTLGSMRSMSFTRSGQWRPALQSISELGR